MSEGAIRSMWTTVCNPSQGRNLRTALCRPHIPLQTLLIPAQHQDVFDHEQFSECWYQQKIVVLE